MSVFKNLIKRVKGLFLWEVFGYLEKLSAESKTQTWLNISQVELSQRQLVFKYQELAKQGKAFLPRLADTGFRVHSQFEEDGLLLYIFTLIGSPTKKCVEIGTTDGTECNTTNLILYHAWKGLLIDGSDIMVQRGLNFFASHPNAVLNEPKMISSWVTKNNIDKLITDNGFTGEIDLLSIDIDGVDYYILDAIKGISPRVVICEINSAVPLNRSVTIPYADDFNCWQYPYPQQMFRGMSMAAANNLMRAKGYRLVGAHRLGFNIIFMKNGVGEEFFPEISLEEARGEYFNAKEMNAVWEDIKGFGWVEV